MSHTTLAVDEVRVGDVLASTGLVTDVTRAAGKYTVVGELDTITARRGGTVIARSLTADRGADWWAGTHRP